MSNYVEDFLRVFGYLVVGIFDLFLIGGIWVGFMEEMEEVFIGDSNLEDIYSR